MHGHWPSLIYTLWWGLRIGKRVFEKPMGCGHRPFQKSRIRTTKIHLQKKEGFIDCLCPYLWEPYTELSSWCVSVGLIFMKHLFWYMHCLILSWAAAVYQWALYWVEQLVCISGRLQQLLREQQSFRPTAPATNHEVTLILYKEQALVRPLSCSGG